MMPSQYSKTIRPDLIGRIASGCDPIGPDDHILDTTFTHDLGRHRVADQGARNSVLLKLPHRQSGTLQERSSLIGVDLYLLALVMGRQYSSQRGSKFRCR